VPESDPRSLVAELLAATRNPIGSTDVFDGASAAPPPAACDEPSPSCAPLPASESTGRANVCAVCVIALAIAAVAFFVS